MTTSFVLVRALTFLTLAVVWYFGNFFIAVPMTIWYVYNFRAYELVLLGVLIDAYFLSEIAIPYYTLGFLGAVILMELTKPSLRKKDTL